jgi:hypothetical protein
MAGNLSNYLENAIINATLRGLPYTSPSAVYVALYTSSPNEDDTGSEVTGSGYVRRTVTFNPPTNGVTTNAADVEWPAASGNWGVITHIALRDASSAGNLLYWAALPSSRTVNNGDVFKMLAGSISLTLD